MTKTFPEFGSAFSDHSRVTKNKTLTLIRFKQNLNGKKETYKRVTIRITVIVIFIRKIVVLKQADRRQRRIYMAVYRDGEREKQTVVFFTRLYEGKGFRSEKTTKTSSNVALRPQIP